MAVFHGTRHDDTFNKSSDTSSDTFDLYKGGNDTAIGGSGDDVFNMGASLNAGDRLDGGSGRDIVTLRGDYSAGVAFDDLTIQNIEVLQLGKGFDYNLTLADGNVAAGAKLGINGTKLGVGDHLIFDGSAETDGHFLIYGGAGDDTITGGAKSDVFHLEEGGNDIAHGGGGNDTFYLGAAFTASDVIDGGAGNDTLDLGLNNGAASTTFAANTMTNVETLKLDSSMTLILSDGNVAAGQILTVWDTASLGNSVNGSAETDGSFHFIGEQSNREDFFSGGAGNDVFDMGDNSSPMNVLNGNGGDDIFSFNANFSNILSTISGGTGSDTLELNGDYTTLAIRADQGHVLGIETLKFLGGHSYTGISIKGDMAGGSTLTIDASAASNLSIDLSAATSAAYAITGSAGADTFKFGSNFSASDTLNGGAGNDTVTLNWNNSIANLTFGQTTILNVENLIFNDGGSNNTVHITTVDENVAAGATLTVDFSSSTTPGGNFNFNGSAETNGHFNIVGPAGVNSYFVTGGALSDTFTLGNDGTASNTINGGSGDDTLTMTTTSVGFKFDGGADNDTLALTGGGTIPSGQVHLISVESLTFDDHDWTVTTGDAMVDSGATLAVDASALTATHSLVFDGSGEADGFFAVTGGAGADTVTYGSHFSVNDSLDGGAGNDTLVLNTVSGHLTFTATTITNVEVLEINSIQPFGLTTNNANVTAGATLTVDASGYNSLGNVFSFDGSAETDGHFNIIGPTSANLYNATGGALSDSFTLGYDGTGNNTINGGGGDDTLTFTAGDTGEGMTFNGGTDNDTLSLTGGGTIIGGQISLNSVEFLTLDDHNWNVTSRDDMVDSGATLIVDGTALTSHALTFNGSGELNGSFNIKGGAGNDTLTGGSLADHIFGGLGADTLTGGGGEDVFVYTAANQSSSTTYDTVTDFAAGTDAFDLTSTVLHIAAVSGTVNTANFDANLQALGASHLQTATVLTVTGGDLNGHVFLVVDGDGNAQYNAGSDYVIDITGYTGTLTTGDFI